MFCINCHSPSTKVINSRPHKKSPHIWRRRSCARCGTAFTTYERPSLADNKPIRISSGKTEAFNIGHLIISISQSFTHNPNEGQKNALWIAQTVEDKLSMDKTALTTEHIALVTYNTLKQYDELAAVQYAARHQLISSVRRRGRPSLRGHEPLS